MRKLSSKQIEISMKWKLGLLVCALGMIIFPTCTSNPSLINFGPRTIILNDSTYNESDIGKFVTWKCKDFINGSVTLFELGKFSHQKLNGIGFVLYDGKNIGEFTSYSRKGINHRWDWGPNGTEFCFIIKPDGKGLFYDFSSVPSGEKTKADDIYMCLK